MSATLLKVEIVTPQHTAYSASAQAITLPGTLGPFQVLINHAPIISSLEIGVIKIIDAEGIETLYATNGGFAEVKDNVVSIVVESAEAAIDIDPRQAQSALEDLQSKYAAAGDHRASDEEKRLIQQARNRVHVVELVSEG